MISSYVRKIAQEAANRNTISFAVVPNSCPERSAYWQLQVIPEGEKPPTYALAVVHPACAAQQLTMNFK